MLTKKYMARHGLAAGAFVYISDSTIVTPENLKAVGDNLFITRLPFSYKEADRVVLEAVRKGEWTRVETGVRSSGSRKAAEYRVCEMTVTIGEKIYRAIVVHSDAHDKRRQKKLARKLAESRKKKRVLLAELDGEWCFTEPLSFEQQQYVQALIPCEVPPVLSLKKAK